MAWLYANHWGAEYHEQGYGILDHVLLRHLPRGAVILDLCCGDGRIAAQLSQSGFDVTGLDSSQQMLGYARYRAPGVPFIAADARDFVVRRPVDAVISTFDALNHVMTTADLARVFGCVFQALKPGGSFVFDLNREEAYTTLWSTTYSIVDPEVVCICAGTYEHFARVAKADFTVFQPAGVEWRRSDFQMKQFCHHEGEVVEALRRSGFDHVKVLDAETDLGMFGNIGRGRNYYSALRPNA